MGTRTAGLASESVAASYNLVVFRSQVKLLFGDQSGNREKREQKLVTLLREAADSERYIGELLDTCYRQGENTGKEEAVRVLSQAGERAFAYFYCLGTHRLETDQSAQQPVHQYRRFICDVLADALAKSDLGVTLDLPSMRARMARGGSQSRELGAVIVRLVAEPLSTPERLEFQRLLERLYSSRGISRRELHQQVVDRLVQSKNPYPLVKELLDFCIARRSEEGLEIGTDILADADDLALDFGRRFFRQDSQRWSHETDTRYHENDDRWTILIRAAGRNPKNKLALLNLLEKCLTAHNRGLSEAVVEGLRAIGGPEAVQLLRGLVTDNDPLIARIAKSALSELAEG
jgi:hypothetical protein